MLHHHPDTANFYSPNLLVRCVPLKFLVTFKMRTQHNIPTALNKSTGVPLPARLLQMRTPEGLSGIHKSFQPMGKNMPGCSMPFRKNERRWRSSRCTQKLHFRQKHSLRRISGISGGHLFSPRPLTTVPWLLRQMQTGL